jgi:hypothetical protein
MVVSEWSHGSGCDGATVWISRGRCISVWEVSRGGPFIARICIKKKISSKIYIDIPIYIYIYMQSILYVHILDIYI